MSYRMGFGRGTVVDRTLDHRRPLCVCFVRPHTPSGPLHPATAFPQLQQHHSLRRDGDPAALRDSERDAVRSTTWRARTAKLLEAPTGVCVGILHT